MSVLARAGQGEGSWKENLFALRFRELRKGPGQTHLNLDAQQAEQIGMIPAGVELLAFDAPFFGFLPFQ